MKKKSVLVILAVMCVISAPCFLAAENVKTGVVEKTGSKTDAEKGRSPGDGSTGDGADRDASTRGNSGQGDTVYPTSDRIILSRTAVPNAAKELNLTGYAAGLWDIAYTVNPNLTIGVVVQLPILSVGVMPHISMNTFLSKHFAIGAGLFAGIWVPYVNNTDASFGVVGGAHFAATYVKGRHMLNLSAMCAGVGSHDKLNGFLFEEGLAVLTSLGYRYSINTNWAFLFEVHAPFVVDFNDSMSNNAAKNHYGEYWGVLYGFRAHGGHVFGDFGFILPISKEFVTGLWRYLPLGIPYFSIGMRF
ncbi:MAG: hypothetical protein JXA07_06865 [Spirochaetes bacterium]|nr:hypothetical protein [Spirochaetota bacterium]